MNEIIIKIQKSPLKKKKYLAYLKNRYTGKIRKLHFGSSKHQQYCDSTNLKIYSKWDHNDPKRRRNYYRRMHKVNTKAEALEKEMKKTRYYYSKKYLSSKFLW